MVTSEWRVRELEIIQCSTPPPIHCSSTTCAGFTGCEGAQPRRGNEKFVVLCVSVRNLGNWGAGASAIGALYRSSGRSPPLVSIRLEVCSILDGMGRGCQTPNAKRQPLANGSHRQPKQLPEQGIASVSRPRADERAQPRGPKITCGGFFKGRAKAPPNKTLRPMYTGVGCRRMLGS